MLFQKQEVEFWPHSNYNYNKSDRNSNCNNSDNNNRDKNNNNNSDLLQNDLAFLFEVFFSF